MQQTREQSRMPDWLRAIGLYAALTVVPGCIIHLAVEACLLAGTESISHFMVRHAYLPLAICVLLGIVYRMVAAAPEMSTRRAMVRMLRALPCQREPAAGYVLSVAIQGLFYALTFAIDSATLSIPKCILAFCVALICAFFSAALLRKLPLALVRASGLLHILRDRRAHRLVLAQGARLFVDRIRRYTDDYVAVAGNRPPPQSRNFA